MRVVLHRLRTAQYMVGGRRGQRGRSVQLPVESQLKQDVAPVLIQHLNMGAEFALD